MTLAKICQRGIKEARIRLKNSWDYRGIDRLGQTAIDGLEIPDDPIY